MSQEVRVIQTGQVSSRELSESQLHAGVATFQTFGRRSGFRHPIVTSYEDAASNLPSFQRGRVQSRRVSSVLGQDLLLFEGGVGLRLSKQICEHS